MLEKLVFKRKLGIEEESEKPECLVEGEVPRSLHLTPGNQIPFSRQEAGILCSLVGIRVHGGAGRDGEARN